MSNRGADGADRRTVLIAAAGGLAVAAGVRAVRAQPATDPLDAPVPAPAPGPMRRAPVHTPLSPRQADILVKALQDAPSHGFQQDEFVVPDLARAMHGGDLSSPQLQDMLKAAVLDYAHAQRGGRIRPSAFPEEWSVRPAPYDPQPEFEAAVATDRLAAWLDSLPPRYEGYLALRKALARYRAVNGGKGWRPAPDGGPLHLGVKDPRVLALRQRLAAEGAETAQPAGDPAVYDLPLAKAVQGFQRRYGLYPDGIAGPPTLMAMNAPLGQRVLEIEANMERWRWLPRELPPTRIQVNIAAAVLAAYRDGEPVLAMKAVAGKPEDATPMLTSTISSIVLNPPWHVPESIARKELWPKAHRDKGYLARNQFTVREGDDGVEHLIQKAGPKSALGRFKFDFPNTFGVYLHDTPAQAGFARTSRLSSHGCVRLEQPKVLTNLLLQGDQDWPPSRVDQVVATDNTTRVALPDPIPVYILYWTAFADTAGVMQFRADAYDWDRKLTGLLNAAKGRDSSSVNLDA